jgi:hypothetical protein
MKLSAGWAVSAVLVVAASAANAQAPATSAGRAQYQAASDVDGPYVGGPQPVPPPGYYAAPPAYGPPAAYGPPGGYGPPLMPPQEVYAVLRDNGFSPLGVPRQRGLVYVIAVVDRGGEDGRLVIDARNGRIIRFTPAFQWGGGGYYEDRYAPLPPYGPPGVLPPMSPISGGEPRPQVSVPHMASRSVPLPMPKPAVAGKLPEPAPQKSAAVEVKPQAPAPKPAAPAATVQAAAPSTPPATVGEAKPAPMIQPTQPMPKVQGLD